MKNILILLFGALLLAALFWWMKPAPEPLPPPVAAGASALPAQAEPVATVPVSPAPQRIVLVVAGGKLVQGPAVISVPQGTPLTLQVTSDAADSLHLHGYDLTLSLKAGEPVELQFLADRSGRFEYELHHAHADLGALEVQPQ